MEPISHKPNATPSPRVSISLQKAEGTNKGTQRSSIHPFSLYQTTGDEAAPTQTVGRMSVCSSGKTCFLKPLFRILPVPAQPKTLKIKNPTRVYYRTNWEKCSSSVINNAQPLQLLHKNCLQSILTKLRPLSLPTTTCNPHLM